MIIESNRVVTINYTLTDGDGNVLDSSEGGGPLVYIQGMDNIIPGLEDALVGKKKGDKLKVTVGPEDAYGERLEEMMQVVSKSEFEDIKDLEAGLQFEVDTDQGPMVFTIVEIRGDEVVLDGNHPLAGETLHFDVEVIDIRNATAEELDHGHAHGPGGHHH